MPIYDLNGDNREKLLLNLRHACHPPSPHRSQFGFYRSELTPCFEKPERADTIFEAVTDQGIGPVCAPESFPLALIERVHTPLYLRFLERAWESWTALGNTRNAIPAVWLIRSFWHNVDPDNVIAQLGLYSFDSGTLFTSGSWQAAPLGTEVALTA